MTCLGSTALCRACTARWAHSGNVEFGFALLTRSPILRHIVVGNTVELEFGLLGLSGLPQALDYSILIRLTRRVALLRHTVVGNTVELEQGGPLLPVGLVPRW